ncbi:MAG TPA: class I SAM-dependent methyltransferase [Thermodesulfovibrionales bacterium]|jgi:ABC-2 type transport system ATP-binding protein|nr:class I SAM-dependent methyltransferase [Thermodesulfovibrionales bacterium]
MEGKKRERYWGAFACTYDDGAEYVVGKALRQAILHRLSEERDLGDTVEFGCGTGYFTTALAVNAASLTATDLSDEMLAVARVRLKDFSRVTISKTDCEGTPFTPESFDTVFMANVLHTIRNPRKALQESYRILKDGGLLLIVLYTDFGMSWFEKMELALRYFVTFGMPPPHGLKNYSPDELGSLVRSVGFNNVEIQLLGDKPKALYLRGRKA